MFLTSVTSVKPFIGGVAFPDRAHATLEVEASLYGDGTWVDMTADLLMRPSLTIEYGIPGAGPTDLVARTGHMTFALNNSATNSAGLLGYYSPESANVRFGFKLGVSVRIRYLLSGVTYFKFTGWLDAIEPVPGKYLDRYTLCTVTDWMGEAAVYRPNVATQVNQRSDQVVAALVASLPRQPTSTSYDVGDSTFAFALDNAKSEAQPVITQLQQNAQSEFGRVYVKGDTTGGGALRMEKRTARLAPLSKQSFNDTMVSLKSPYDRGRIINKVKATTHPRTADVSGAVVLFKHAGTPKVTAGSTVTITGRYNDPNARAIRIGGKDMVASSSGTDYTMFASSSGAGADLTSQFTVATVFGANQAVFTIKNTSGTDGFITLLQARGNGLYDYNPVESISASTSSTDSYGERQLVLDMPSNSDAAVAQAVADYLRDVYKDPGSVEITLGLLATDTASLAASIPIEVGDVITVTETVTGIASAYFVNNVRLIFETPTIVNVEWLCQKAPVQNYWTLETVGKSELDQTTVPAPL